MSLDEFETIRLIDKEGMTQEEASVKMGVARTTVTSIYESARKKIADSLVDGKRLQISGGAYRLKEIFNLGVIKKGLNIMRIAVTYEEGNIFQHFGHTEQFKLYDVEDGKIVSSQVVDTNGSGHGALAGFLKAAGADALICGGIGMGAQMALAEAGIKLYGGVQGSADEAAKALAEGNLNYDPDAKCDHHGHGEDHNCGHADHECGHGSCHN
jgi:predicted Fe-Mo cluster-binding NifX family protein